MVRVEGLLVVRWPTPRPYPCCPPPLAPPPPLPSRPPGGHPRPGPGDARHHPGLAGRARGRGRRGRDARHVWRQARVQCRETSFFEFRGACVRWLVSVCVSGPQHWWLGAVAPAGPCPRPRPTVLTPPARVGPPSPPPPPPTPQRLPRQLRHPGRLPRCGRLFGGRRVPEARFCRHCQVRQRRVRGARARGVGGTLWPPPRPAAQGEGGGAWLEGGRAVPGRAALVPCGAQRPRGWWGGRPRPHVGHT